nr:hypothetical protein [Piscinibacter defluvii]
MSDKFGQVFVEVRQLVALIRRKQIGCNLLNASNLAQHFVKCVALDEDPREPSSGVAQDRGVCSVGVDLD